MFFQVLGALAVMVAAIIAGFKLARQFDGRHPPIGKKVAVYSAIAIGIILVPTAIAAFVALRDDDAGGWNLPGLTAIMLAGSVAGGAYMGYRLRGLAEWYGSNGGNRRRY